MERPLGRRRSYPQHRPTLSRRKPGPKRRQRGGAVEVSTVCTDIRFQKHPNPEWAFLTMLCRRVGSPTGEVTWMRNGTLGSIACWGTPRVCHALLIARSRRSRAFCTIVGYQYGCLSQGKPSHSFLLPQLPKPIRALLRLSRTQSFTRHPNKPRRRGRASTRRR